MSFQVVSGQGYIQDSTITPAKLTFMTPQYVGTTTLSAPAATLATPTLDLDAETEYILSGSITQTSGSTATIKGVCNADTTATNYYNRFFRIAGTSVSGNSLINNNTLESLATNGHFDFIGRIIKEVGTDNPVIVLSISSGDGASVHSGKEIHLRWNNGANLTAFTLSSDQNLDAGSFIRVWKADIA